MATTLVCPATGARLEPQPSSTGGETSNPRIAEATPMEDLVAAFDAALEKRIADKGDLPVTGNDLALAFIDVTDRDTMLRTSANIPYYDPEYLEVVKRSLYQRQIPHIGKTIRPLEDSMSALIPERSEDFRECLEEGSYTGFNLACSRQRRVLLHEATKLNETLLNSLDEREKQVQSSMIRVLANDLKNKIDYTNDELLRKYYQNAIDTGIDTLFDLGHLVIRCAFRDRGEYRRTPENDSDFDDSFLMTTYSNSKRTLGKLMMKSLSDLKRWQKDRTIWLGDGAGLLNCSTFYLQELRTRGFCLESKKVKQKTERIEADSEEHSAQEIRVGCPAHKYIDDLMRIGEKMFAGIFVANMDVTSALFRRYEDLLFPGRKDRLLGLHLDNEFARLSFL